MAIIKCSECGNIVSTKAVKCPHCGAPVAEPIRHAQVAPEKTLGCGTYALIALGILLLLFLFGLWSSSTPTASVSDTTAIEEAAKVNFEKSISAKYTELVNYRIAGDMEGQLRLIKQFENSGRLDYRNVTAYAKAVHSEEPAYKVKIATSNLEARLAETPQDDNRTRAAIYRALSNKNPSNKEYATNADKYELEWKRDEVALAVKTKLDLEEHQKEEKKKAAALAAITAEQAKTSARSTKIRHQFSGWDGSHTALEKIIKRSMNDPDSYDHVETRYTDMGDYLMVETTFRGRNGFGGVVLNRIRAKFTIDGSLLDIVYQGP